MEDGDITVDNEVHNECVLFKSSATEDTPVPPTPEEPKRLPDT
jgi:hypothetical protein